MCISPDSPSLESRLYMIRKYDTSETDTSGQIIIFPFPNYVQWYSSNWYLKFCTSCNAIQHQPDWFMFLLVFFCIFVFGFIFFCFPVKHPCMCIIGVTLADQRVVGRLAGCVRIQTHRPVITVLQQQQLQVYWSGHMLHRSHKWAGLHCKYPACH